MGIEKLNRYLYDSKEQVLRISKWITFLSASFALGIIIYENGFVLPYSHLAFIMKAFDVILIIFVLNYLIRVLYSFNRLTFLKNTWFEGLLMFLVTVVTVSKFFFDFSITQNIIEVTGTHYAKEVYRYAITLTILYLVGFEIIKISSYLSYLTIKPAATFILSFLILVFLGTFLLMLPRMTVMDGGASFMDAFFTSVSASCVTGLSIVDTGTFFTFKGKLVILILFQLGGIGIVSFATFFATFLKKGVGIKHQLIIQDFLNSESLYSSKTLLRQVIGITLSIELISSICIFFTWGNQIVFDSVFQKIFYSIFHAVSAFCNAGFSLFSNSLYQEQVQSSYLLHIIVAITIIIGSLGFSSIQDLMSPARLRERLDKPWMGWKIGTKVAVYTSVVLTILGTLVFFLLELNNEETLKGKSIFEQGVLAFFQSVTARTAGFNSINIGAMAIPSVIFMIFLMFIGASSGSTGGGIKTSTFLLISLSSLASITGRKYVELYKRTISSELINKAFTIFSFAVTYNLLMIFVLTITDGDLPILTLVFEQVSAFATAGLSMGITADLSVVGKSIIILSMFLGRIGTLTLALALSSRVKCNSYQYPEAHLMVG